MKKIQKKTNWKHIIGIFGGSNYVLLFGNGHGISYNPNTHIGALIPSFGGDGNGQETALIEKVKGETKYYILNGDFRKEYEKLVPKGINACKKFYQSKKDKYGSSWTND